ncbi:hypothetical protein BDQ12DRAFT_588473, partial [Crucibulum laeve]
QILQLNLRKSEKAHLAQINGNLAVNWDLILIQEPHLTFYSNIHTPNGFCPISP